MELLCNATATTLTVSWHEASNASVFELQLWRGINSSNLATTSSEPEVFVADLVPATSYYLAVRSRSCADGDVCRWGALTAPARCTTLALASDQARVLPPATAPTPTSVMVRLEAPQNSTATLLEFRDATASATAWSDPIRIDGTSWALDGLGPGRRYEVRATALLRDTASGVDVRGTPSEPTVFLTADPSWSSFVGYRVSELCGQDCQPDYLSEKDMGDLETVLGYLLEDDISFNRSVVSRYCVRRAPQPFAQYLSCNGPTIDEYACGCGNYADRCLGRQDKTVCNMSAPLEPPLSALMLPMPPCTCSEAELENSHNYVGRMPFYLQNPMWLVLDYANMTAPSLVGCSTPPVDQAVELGSWYSMPSRSECSPLGHPPSPHIRRGSCSWARDQTAHFIRGGALILADFNRSVTPDNLPLDWVRESSAVVRGLLDQGAGERCCGC